MQILADPDFTMQILADPDFNINIDYMAWYNTNKCCGYQQGFGSVGRYLFVFYGSRSSFLK